MKHNNKICVVGLGYVGLPLAVAFSKHFDVVGYDINTSRVENLKKGFDKTEEVSTDDLKKINIEYASQLESFPDCNVYIVTVPTPIDPQRKPDLSYLKAATASVGENLKSGDIVVFESTTYPGCTERVCVPILEQKSSLKINLDFGVGYSPERINPADKNFKIHQISKIISGSNKATLNHLAWLYGEIIEADIITVSSIKVAEAAKLIENIQRDVNIALINEYASFLKSINVNANEVIDAASTKWNFVDYRPGLVGGHCISVDPYYLISEAKKQKVSSRLISLARDINESKSKEISQYVKANKPPGSRVGVLGVTFKENCPDIRNSKVLDIMLDLENDFEIEFWDPYFESFRDELPKKFKYINFSEMKDLDVLIIAVNHQQIRDFNDEYLLKMLTDKAIVFDVKNSFPNLDSKSIDRQTL